ncbi:FtsW/RodA/SpoVE family cell cycle protein [Streptomyces sp. 549]|uniref:FtsW/RodA/SpoVE family cell cycle protein n=1 Tax=Streptomyces sp. 549 TaxID=3049076 RepID=UPI0024C3D3D3|nr:FtsW/RodA/SpoVE family cell cycle protein [Streptomyces sp. 549]MDK1472551.1 FtsW/RodA/SpoVE family cell cycle protein [Streptomyces sp. 549]
MARRRSREGLLVLFAVLVAAAGHATAGFALEGALPSGYAVQVAGLGSLGLLAHLAVRRFARYADPLLLPLAVMLSGLGLVLLSRLDHSYAEKYRAPEVAAGQAMWNALGIALLVVLLVVMRHHRVLQRYTYLGMAVSMVLLMAPALFGADEYGAKRWIRLGGLSVQPGEFVKILIVIFFASYLTANRDALALAGRRVWGLTLPRGRNAGPVLVVWVLSLLVLVLERDLGTSLIFFGVFVIMLYAATERTSWVVCGVLMAAAGAFVVGSVEPHVKGRVTAWLNPLAIYLPPEQQPPGLVSDQPAEALFSFATGGLTGTGLGEGQPWLIKFAGRSDFILTTVGEELGLLGTTLVILLYALLVQRGLRTALATPDPFGKLLALGLSVTIALQLFVVGGGVSGLVPLTGKALPFLAQGGSSTVANWLLVALLIRISDSAGRAAVAPKGNATILTPAVASADVTR